MNKTDTEARIRTLLDRYYEGTSTPAEQCEALELMRGLEPLPGEFEADFELLSLLEEIPGEVPETVVPETLESQLRLTVRTLGRTDRLRRRRRAFMWSAAAVATIVLGATGVKIATTDMNLSGNRNGMAQMADSTVPEPLTIVQAPGTAQQALSDSVPQFTLPETVPGADVPVVAESTNAAKAGGKSRRATASVKLQKEVSREPQGLTPEQIATMEGGFRIMSEAKRELRHSSNEVASNLSVTTVEASRFKAHQMESALPAADSRQSSANQNTILIP